MADTTPDTSKQKQNAGFMLGVKQYMTQLFDESGTVAAATVVAAGPITVTQVKRSETDGYDAVQYGFGSRREGNVGRAVRTHMKKAGGVFRVLREARGGNDKSELGDVISVADVFAVGDTVSVSGVSKGKGFQGVVKRHGFAGGRRSHGNKHHERAPGSIGATGPQRVFKGTRMAGRMGGERVTVKGLRVLRVDGDTNTLVISGALPGRRGTLLEIRKG